MSETRRTHRQNQNQTVQVQKSPQQYEQEVLELIKECQNEFKHNPKKVDLINAQIDAIDKKMDACRNGRHFDEFLHQNKNYQLMMVTFYPLLWQINNKKCQELRGWFKKHLVEKDAILFETRYRPWSDYPKLNYTSQTPGWAYLLDQKEIYQQLVPTYDRERGWYSIPMNKTRYVHQFLNKEYNTVRLNCSGVYPKKFFRYLMRKCWCDRHFLVMLHNHPEMIEKQYQGWVSDNPPEYKAK